MDFDAIVVGSGITGGWAAKELCEQGFKVLLIERGRKIEHGTDYTDNVMPWELENRGKVDEDEAARDYAVQSKVYAFNTATKHYWVKDTEHPYETPEGKPFTWIRGYHLGGRSLMWGRAVFRLSDIDFGANARDGHGVDWPIRYADLAPWYDKVERFIGVAGTREGMAQLPDGVFQPPLGLTAIEKDFQGKLAQRYPGRRLINARVAHLTAPTEEQTDLGRGRCQSRNVCERGCSFGAYFSSLSATIPAADKTGNLTILTDTIVESVVYDPQTRRAKGVRVIDAATKEGRTIEARVVFLCASTIPTAQILLNSKSDAFPTGLANRSDQVGRNLMDHFGAIYAGISMDHMDRYYRGRRPSSGAYLPRYSNVSGQTEDYVRGFGFQVTSMRGNWTSGSHMPGVGAGFKEQMRQPGPWRIVMSGMGEMLPNPENRVSLHATRKDQWGMPVLNIVCERGENERKIEAAMERDALDMLSGAGMRAQTIHLGDGDPGGKIHEMGTARMGRDPATSVLNAHNQAHDVQNLYVTDGSAMASSATQNPSLTYMALTARAAAHAGEQMRAGVF